MLKFCLKIRALAMLHYSLSINGDPFSPNDIASTERDVYITPQTLQLHYRVKQISDSGEMTYDPNVQQQ